MPTSTSERPASTAALKLGALGLALGLGLLAPACFTPPADDVLFACEPEGLDDCPPGYDCEADGCCHRGGSDLEAMLGACALGGQDGGSSGSEDVDTGSEVDTGGLDDGETEGSGPGSEGSSDTQDGETTDDADAGTSESGPEPDTGVDSSSEGGFDTGSDTGFDTGG